jgi:hypothetical protein
MCSKGDRGREREEDDMHNLDRGAFGPNGPESFEAYESAEFESGEYEHTTGEQEAGEFETGEFEAGEFEAGEFEAGEFEAGEFEGGELENEDFLGLLGSLLGEAHEMPTGPGRPLSEAQETELASELLEVSTEQELEQFLGDLMRGAARAAGAFIRSDTGRALGGVLRDATKQALPIVGRAVGQWVSPTGGDTGARIGNAVGVAFGLELEGLSGESQEFEVARALIRFADAAARQAAITPRVVPAPVAVRRAVITAASEHAPGLLAGVAPGVRGDRYGTRGRRSGRWIRRGRKLVIFDA